MRRLQRVLAVAALCGLCAAVTAAADDADPCPPYPEQLISYALGSGERIRIDGKLDDAAWQAVAWSDAFVDISGSPPQPVPRFGTRVKTRWDDKFIYFGALLQEPNVWANMTEHDSVIFNDNDFEVFIDPDGSTHHYKEFEINAINVFWDLELNKPYIDGGQANNSWDMLGVAQTATYVDGPVNDPNAGVDKYWTVELALPHAYYVQQCFQARSPPHNGDLWRINFSRVEYRVQVVDGEYQKVPGTSADNWVWQSQGTVNMHLPERWGMLQFSTAAVNTSHVERDPTWHQRSALAQTYYAEHEFEAVNGYYTQDLSQLSTLPAWVTNGACGTAAPNVTFPGGEIYRFAASVLSTAQPELPVGNIQDDRLIWFGDVPPPDSTA